MWLEGTIGIPEDKTAGKKVHDSSLCRKGIR